jgi:two-component system sensor histidine kinase KdpD
MLNRIPLKAGLPAALAAVCLVTVIFKEVAAVNATTVGFAYLITILLIAAWAGIVESVLASIAATFCFNYFFLPPVGTWVISDPQNWVALFAFLMTALIASELSRRARRRRMEMERLYSLSRSIMTMDDNQPVGERIAFELARICEIPAVAIYDCRSDTIFYGGSDSIFRVESRLRETALKGVQVRDEPTDTLFAPISLGGQTTGSVAIQGGVLASTALHAVLNLVGIALENASSREMATRSQAAQQSQEFKSTLIDGLAHEFKTPLTSIRAATTALLASNISNSARHELTMVVDQEVDRLSRLVTEATHIARIEAGHIQINRRWLSIHSIVENVLSETEVQRDGRRVDVSVPADLPRVFIDGDLVQLALRQLVDNALKYSLRGTSIQISSRLADHDFLISVHNQGEPLSEPERARVFDKFYRGENVRHQVAGTGMGLPVAREILLAHGGDIVLESSDKDGTEFVMTIPATAK